MNNILPTLKIGKNNIILESNGFTKKKTLDELVMFEGSILDYNNYNVLSRDDSDICYKIFCKKNISDEIIVHLINVSEENMILRKASHDIRNVGNTINSFLYLSKKMKNPKSLIPHLDKSLTQILQIGKNLDNFATRKIND